MQRRLPPLPALRAFEAAARRMSFARAAVDLCVTPSAVSHQVKALEDFLGTALFRREAAGLALTGAGESYRRDLTRLLDMLDVSTRRVSRRGDDRPLRVLSTPGFAARWLVPRLGSFAGHERIEMLVSQGAPCTDFAANGADVVIHWGAEPVPGVVVEPMIQSSRYPVASPALVERAGNRLPARPAGCHTAARRGAGRLGRVVPPGRRRRSQPAARAAAGPLRVDADRGRARAGRRSGL